MLHIFRQSLFKEVLYLFVQMSSDKISCVKNKKNLRDFKTLHSFTPHSWPMCKVGVIVKVSVLERQKLLKAAPRISLLLVLYTVKRSAKHFVWSIPYCQISSPNMEIYHIKAVMPPFGWGNFLGCNHTLLMGCMMRSQQRYPVLHHSFGQNCWVKQWLDSFRALCDLLVLAQEKRCITCHHHH